MRQTYTGNAGVMSLVHYAQRLLLEVRDTPHDTIFQVMRDTVTNILQRHLIE